MVIDISTFIKGAKRQITSRDYNGKPARVLTVSRTYATTAEDMWDALTTIDRIPKWFLPISGDIAVGGRFQLENNAAGQVVSCDPPRAFNITWEYGGEVSWVNVSLQPQGDETLFTLEHIAHVPEELWSVYGPGAVGVGWDLGLYGLHRHLVEKAEKPQDEGAWTTHGEGREYATLSSGAWGVASAEAGTPREEAMAAADRTTAFYTGDSGETNCQ